MKRMLTTCVVLAMGAGMAMGATNTVPYSESFESYTNGHELAGTGGWYAVESDALVVETNEYSSDFNYGYYPLSNATHTKVLHLQSDATNLVESSTGPVWVDTVLSPTLWDQETQPEVPSDAQMAYYVNTNRHPVIRHGLGGFVDSNVWTEIPEVTIVSGSWARITINMDYTFDGIHSYFQMYIDGQLITNALGWATNNFSSSNPGSWFALANSANTYISALGLNGTGLFDDLVVTNGAPYLPPPPAPSTNTYTITASVVSGNGTIAPSGAVEVVEGNSETFTMTPDSGWAIDDVRIDTVSTGTPGSYTFTDVQTNHALDVDFATNVYGIPVSWLENAGITNDHKNGALLDQDGDGITTSNEWRSSTDPLDSNSLFKVSDAVAGSFEITWYSTNIDASLPDFQVERRPDLLTGNWSIVDGAVPRQEVNTWVDTNTPPVKAFYRLIAP